MSWQTVVRESSIIKVCRVASRREGAASNMHREFERVYVLWYFSMVPACAPSQHGKYPTADTKITLQRTLASDVARLLSTVFNPCSFPSPASTMISA